MLTNVVVVAKPTLLFTYQFTSWLENNVDVKPASGIGHSGNGVTVLMVGGPLTGPIETVVEDQSPTTVGTRLHFTGRTCKSKLPHHPMFHVIIPVS